MKNTKYLLLLVLLFLISGINCSPAIDQEKEIVVVILSYNNRAYYERNLNSILSQDYGNYKVIYIDDCSPDGTGQLVEDYLRLYDQDKRVTLVKNPYRRGALANHWQAVQFIADHKIVVHCDGDDWYINNHVLKRINEEYQDSDVWMTYGSYVCYPSGKIGYTRSLPFNVIEENRWRTVPYFHFCSQIRTFYAWLFKQIKLADLQINNKFFPVACDVGFMYPMLEMAHKHVRFISDILYVYNQENPINDGKHSAKLQIGLTKYVMEKEPYQAINRLPFEH